MSNCITNTHIHNCKELVRSELTVLCIPTSKTIMIVHSSCHPPPYLPRISHSGWGLGIQTYPHTSNSWNWLSLMVIELGFVYYSPEDSPVTINYCLLFTLLICPLSTHQFVGHTTATLPETTDKYPLSALGHLRLDAKGYTQENTQHKSSWLFNQKRSAR